MGNCLGKSKKSKNGFGGPCHVCQHPADYTCEKCTAAVGQDMMMDGGAPMDMSGSAPEGESTEA